MKVKLTIDADLQDVLYKMGDEATRVAEKAVKEAGAILYEALREEINNNAELSEKQKTRYLSDMEQEYTTKGDYVFGEVGWLFDNYNATPTPTGVKVLWAEYGTKQRTTKAGQNRGYLSPAYFVTTARKKSASKIRKKQEEIINSEFEKIIGAKSG